MFEEYHLTSDIQLGLGKKIDMPVSTLKIRVCLEGNFIKSWGIEEYKRFLKTSFIVCVFFKSKGK